MSIIIIAKNNIGSAINIEDLGIEVPGSSQLDLTEFFSITEISESNDLVNEISSGNIIINNGIIDLSISDALDYISLETISESSSNTIKFYQSISDFPINGLENILYFDKLKKYIYSWDNANSKYNLLNNRVQLSNNPPLNPDPGTIWTPDNSQGTLYSWDDNSQSWVSVFRSILTFARGGNVDGSFLSVGGWYGTNYYYISKPGIIYSIYCAALSGNNTKSFDVKLNNISKFNFSFPNKLEYLNDNLNIQISPTKKLQVFCNYSGSKVRNVICQIEIAWRYTI